MKYLQAIAVLMLLVVSKRYRKRWHDAADRLGETNDFVEASFRRIAVMHNGGKPDIKIVK